MTQLHIAEYRVEDLYVRVKKFNNKATKLGLPLITVAQTGIEAREFTRENALGEREKFSINVVSVELTGEIPRIGGWAIHSKVEPSQVPGSNFVYTQPHFDAVEGLRTTKMICEHCNMKRGRSLVYLLQNVETGEQKLVGKSCLKDFLPNIDVGSLLAYLESFHTLSSGDTLDEDCERAPREAFVYGVRDLIAESLVLIKKWGYKSKKMARELNDDMIATVEWVARTNPKDRKELYPVAELTPVYESGEVEKVLAFLNDLNPRDDFGYNLQLAIKQVNAPVKMFSFVVAGVNMYLKSVEKAAEAAVKTNEWVGTVGERVVLKGLKLVRCTPVETNFGMSFVTGFEDEDGRTFIWFASKKIGDVGEVMDLKTTIKKHDEYKGVKQTVITRAAKQ
jgi:hypothetical protein